MLMNTSARRNLRLWLATLVVVPALMFTVVPVMSAQGTVKPGVTQNSRNKTDKTRRHTVPEGGLLATAGIALAVVASATYRRRRNWKA